MRLLLTFTLFSLLGFVYGQTEIESKVIKVNLQVGADKLYQLDFTPNSVVDIVNSKVAGVTLLPQRKEIAILALSKGRTNLRLRDNQGNSKVVFEITAH